MHLAWFLRPLFLDTKKVFWKHVQYDNSFLLEQIWPLTSQMTLTHCRHQPDQISSLNIAVVKKVWWKRHNKNNVFQSLILMIQKVWLKNIPRMNCGPSSQLSLYTCIIIPLICFQYCIVACIQNWGKLLREHNKY